MSLSTFPLTHPTPTKKVIRGQFHQHFMSPFALIFLRQKSSNLKCKYKKALRITFIQKSALKMLVKLTPDHKLQSTTLFFMCNVAKCLEHNSFKLRLSFKQEIGFVGRQMDIILVMLHQIFNYQKTHTFSTVFNFFFYFLGWCSEQLLSAIFSYLYPHS